MTIIYFDFPNLMTDGPFWSRVMGTVVNLSFYYDPFNIINNSMENRTGSGLRDLARGDNLMTIVF
jgi:hypothetical protein